MVLTYFVNDIYGLVFGYNVLLNFQTQSICLSFNLINVPAV